METLCLVAHELLTCMNADYLETPFYEDLKMIGKKTWRELTVEVLQSRDQATLCRYQQEDSYKKRKEEQEDMIEMRFRGKRRNK